jgi:tRNA (guanosine-2'-O-)-methyltransferase
MKEGLMEHMLSFVSGHKKELFERILAQRTNWFTLVLEDMYQMQNASAVVRTCDCLGVQDIHVVENRNKFKTSDVSKGAEKWINIHRHISSEAAFRQLKADGYKMVLVSPHGSSYDVQQLPIDQKLALVFGTEYAGVSQYSMDNADMSTYIPMYGFTESFNVSVSAAIALSTLFNRLRASDLPWKLAESERTALLYQWAKSAVRAGDLIEKQYLQSE